MKFIQPTWPAPAHIKAYTTTRSSWGTHYHPADDAEKNLAYLEDHKKLKALLELPNDPIWISQTHSTTAITATGVHKNTVADASLTTEKNQVCVVMTADCLPILVTTTDGSHVAAIHAGWRGLSKGIVENTLSQMSCDKEKLLIWLGPAIGPSHFEVGEDVYSAFVSQNSQAAKGFQSLSTGKYLANLYALAKIRLNQLGVNHIYGGDFCTYTQSDLFFSYRRDQGHVGRMASLIWIAED